MKPFWNIACKELSLKLDVRHIAYFMGRMFWGQVCELKRKKFGPTVKLKHLDLCNYNYKTIVKYRSITTGASYDNGMNVKVFKCS